MESEIQPKLFGSIPGKPRTWFEKFKNWITDKTAAFSRFFTFRKHYYLEAQQAFRKAESEFYVLKSIVTKKDNITNEEADTIIEIEKLIGEAHKQITYAELWPYIHLIELHLIRLYDKNSLLSYLSIVRNNLYSLNEADRKEWEAKLNPFVSCTEESKMDTDCLRRILYTITSEINEVRRISFMTSDLKRDLMKRFIRITVVIGVLAWIFIYSILRDPLVHYAVIIGVLGGFFSRILSIQTLEFKPPAFALLSLYTYTQPLLGGIGALLLYILLISPLGPELISTNTFYLQPSETTAYIDALVKKDTSTFLGNRIPLIVPDTSTAKIVINNYPKPGLFLILAFIAGFSERWLLGTIDNIVGAKLKKKEEAKPKPEETSKI